MNRSDLKISQGGLMRCCVHSAYTWIAAQPHASVKPGDLIACKYENKMTMVVDDAGAVRLRQPQEKTHDNDA